jgi:hypothetical protein
VRTTSSQMHSRHKFGPGYACPDSPVTMRLAARLDFLSTQTDIFVLFCWAAGNALSPLSPARANPCQVGHISRGELLEDVVWLLPTTSLRRSATGASRLHLSKRTSFIVLKFLQLRSFCARDKPPNPSDSPGVALSVVGIFRHSDVRYMPHPLE